MSPPTFSERFAATLVGAVFGAVIGFALAWLLGVFSNTLGPGQLPVSFPKWALAGATLFGCVGAVFGSSVGTLLGNGIAGLFAFERAEEEHVPRWLVVVVFAAAVPLALWLASGTS